MPPEKTKALVIEKLTTDRKRLEQNLSRLTPEEMVLPGVVGSWSVKDVLAHLADWEAHMPAWVQAARTGDPVAQIEEGLKWGEFDAFNQRIYARHRDQTLEEVLAYFHQVHQKFMEMVAAMPDEELLQRGRYGFIGNRAVYDWLSQYAGHDRWAKTKIRKWMKTRS